jgi:hypothetical protein
VLIVLILAPRFSKSLPALIVIFPPSIEAVLARVLKMLVALL